VATRIVITGTLGPKEDAKAIAWLAQSVADERPDEIVCTEGSVTLLDRLQEVFDGPIGVHGGIFETRHEVTALPAVYEIAPGWVSVRDGGDIKLSRIAGNTALNAAKRLGASVVLGHTGRMGIGSYTSGYGGNGKVVTGMEVGNLADMRMVKGSDAGTAWQQGFGILTVDGQHVTPEGVARSLRRSYSKREV